MTNIRVEIHLTPREVKELEKISKLHGRSRKNYLETAIRSIIQSSRADTKEPKQTK